MKLHTLVLYYLLKKVANKREHDVVIGDLDKPTYYRWHLLGNKKPKPEDTKPMSRTILGCKFYLHGFMRDDANDLHDHISINISWVLSECGYKEERFLYTPNPFAGKLPGTYIVERNAGSLTFRFGRTAHRVILHEDAYTGKKPCWSLFMVFPAYREWGFWCPNGVWRHYLRYTSSYGQKGVGCE